MPAFRKILSTTTLCLAAVGLSSCYSTLHKYVWNRAKVAEQAAWFGENNNIALYGDGENVYAKGYIGSARGCFSGYPVNSWGAIPIGGCASLCPDETSATPVFFQLDKQYAAYVLQQEAREETRVPIGSSFKRTQPTAVRPLKIRGYKSGLQVFSVDNAFSTPPITTDAHKYYAYPLGVVTLVAVDSPISIALNAPVVCVYIVALPFSGISSLYRACTQNTPEPPTQSPPEHEAPRPVP